MIKKLFYTPPQGSYQQTDHLSLSESGIEGAQYYHPWRQLLLMPTESLDDFNLETGQLKENILFEIPEKLYDLDSGTVLQIGEAQLRLTFHCEPCSKLKSFITPSKLTHNRGYLAQIIKAGEIKAGDTISVLKKRFDAIPYSAIDRIEWFLTQHPQPIFASELVDRIALHKSYCRALPRILKKRPLIDPELILYKKDQ